MSRVPKLPALICAAMVAGCAGASSISENSTGAFGGHFYTFWRDTGVGRMQVGRGGDYSLQWRLGQAGNLVAGTGWASGATDRVIRYRAEAFEPGRNGYLTLYGWSTGPLVEYYVVESWGEFVPPGGDAQYLGDLESDGGVYRIYRTRRVDKPSIVGTATFDQYWSVRTTKRPLDSDATITFGNHVAAWEAVGLHLGVLDYQVLATEGFGSDGHSDIRLRN